MGQKKVNSKNLKVVIDCNVFISAVLFSGKPSLLAELWKSGHIQILMSKEVLNEYIKVLSYPKFKLTSPEIKFILQKELFPYIKIIKVKSYFKIVVEDSSDDMYLSLAYEGKATALISGDRHLLSLKKFKGIKILTVNEFLT